jgi:3-oxoacyl-[acyl-carrier-protein] synthase II
MRARITGLGAVSPLGLGMDENWAKLTAGVSGISRIKSFDTSEFRVQIAGEIRDFDPAEFLPAVDARRFDSYASMAVVAAIQAVEQSGIDFSRTDPTRVSVVVGTGYGCTEANTAAVRLLDSAGPSRFTPLPSIYSAQDVVAGYLSIRWGLRGEALCLSAACASGTVAIGNAMRLISSGEADVVIVIGADGAVTPRDLAVVSGARALTAHYNDSPTNASRPFDRERDGFVLSAGGAALVLESAEHAARRGANVAATLLGYGAATDAHHLSAPHPEGRGAVSAMSRALATAGLEPSDIDHVNAHGTSTKLNDYVEARALQTVFGPTISETTVTSTKSMTGHMIGAAGTFEAAVAVMTMQNSTVPPTINCTDLEFEFLNLVRDSAREQPITYAMSNSFGFGGHCASVVIGPADA